MIDADAVISAYREHGYAMMPEFFTPEETAQLRAVTAQVEAEAAGLTENTPVFDFEPSHTAENPKIQRIKKPNRVDVFFDALSRHEKLLAVIGREIGVNIRLNHTKINMKYPQVGSPLEWHQDWAFAPHTNMDTIVASVFIDDCHEANGPLTVIPGSHKLGLLDHHDEEGFVGAIGADNPGVDFSKSVSLLGKAGTVALHHPLTVHGSATNSSGDSRRILFYEYAATDAYPLFYPVEWGEYNARIVAGPETSVARLAPVYVKLPYPAPGSSIYKTQARLRARFFTKAEA